MARGTFAIAAGRGVLIGVEVAAGTERVVEGPYFEDLHVGEVVDTAPSVTITDGLAAVHRSIIGDRLRIALDHDLGKAVTGAIPASPALVWDVAIGQSTLVTEHVIANLFYRGLAFRRLPAVGDTLSTRTEVVGLREHTPRRGRRPTGAAALRITTSDQSGRPVLDFWRCAMLPLRDASRPTGAADDLDAVGSSAQPDTEAVAGWDLARLARTAPRVRSGERLTVSGGVLVSAAAELARLTGNVARVHHDAAAAGGQRLVYGGHTIGLAFGQICRALPDLVAVLGWHRCDHLAPVHEGDTLTSQISVQQVDATESAAVADLRCLVNANGSTPVLDWGLRVLVA